MCINLTDSKTVPTKVRAGGPESILYADPVNPLPDDKMFDWFKLKQITDDILKCI